MQRIFRLLAPFALIVVSAALVACGGGSDAGGEPASKDTDVNKLLDQIFSGKDKKVESGKIDLSIELNASGGGSTLNGPVSVKLSGPFQSQGAKMVPKFDLDLEFSGAGQNIKASATSTGDKAFIGFNGQDYVASDEVFQQFKQGFEQAQNQGSSGQSLADYGIDPQNWLKDPKVEGDSKVGDTDTVKITGGVDVPKLVDDISTLLSKAGELGVPNTGQVPTQLTDQQKQQVIAAVKSASVEIEAGKDDSILRRFALKTNIADPGGSGGTADVSLDLSLTGLNQDQEINAPSDTKPLEELLGQLGGLGGLGALGGGAGTTPGATPGASGSSGSGSSSGSSGGAGGVSSVDAQKYTQCVQAAGSDVTKAQKCASIITP